MACAEFLLISSVVFIVIAEGLSSTTPPTTSTTTPVTITSTPTTAGLSSTTTPTTSTTTPVTMTTTPTTAGLSSTTTPTTSTTTPVKITTTPTTAACRETLMSQTGTIQSPDTISNSSNELSCVYVITAPYKYRVTLTFTSLHLEPDPGCLWNYVEIRDGDSESSPRLGLFCNTPLSGPLRTFGNQMWIKFATNSSRTNFKATYTSAVHQDSFLLITSSSSSVTGNIFRVDPETRSNISVPMSAELYNPIAVDFDPLEQTIYWTEVGVFNRIRSSSLNGSNIHTVRDAGPGAVLDGLAVDPLSRLIFYTDAGNKQIVMVTMSSLAIKTVINSNLDRPRAIVLDTLNGLMFWTDWGKRPKIERANYDGSDRKAVISNFIKDINAVALDVAKNRLYWVDSATNLVEMSDMDGNGRKILLKVDDTHLFFGLALLHDSLYMTDWGPGQRQSLHSIVSRLTVEEKRQSVFASVSARLNDIHGYNAEQPQKFSNGCSNNNGDCDAICLPLPGNSNKCTCPDGQSLSSNLKTCFNGTQEAESAVNTSLIAGAVVGSIAIVAAVVIVIVIVIIKRRRDSPYIETPVVKNYSDENPYSKLRVIKSFLRIKASTAGDAETESDYSEVIDIGDRPPQPIPASSDSSHNQQPEGDDYLRPTQPTCYDKGHAQQSDRDDYLHPVSLNCDVDLRVPQSDFKDYLDPTQPVCHDTLREQQSDCDDYLHPTQPVCHDSLREQQSDCDDYLHPTSPNCDANPLAQQCDSDDLPEPVKLDCSENPHTAQPKWDDDTAV